MTQPLIFDHGKKQWLPYTPPLQPRGTHCIERREDAARILETPGGMIETDEIRIDAQGKKHKTVRPAPYRLLVGRDRIHTTRYSPDAARDRARRWGMSADEFKITTL